jgi:hypothetical protein
MNGEKKISFAYAPQEEFLDTIKNKNNNSATLLINARVQASPERLFQLM